MNELKIFTNEEFGNVRTVSIDGNVLFVASDIAKCLGYKKPNNAVNTHCKHATLKQGSITDSLGRKQNALVIPEGDIYRLISHSELPDAEKFESWVFDEVLPTIRKTGGYINNSDLMVNTYFSDIDDEHKVLVKGLLSNIEEKQKKIVSLENENDLLSQKNLKWADRPLINSLVRAYACGTDGQFGKAWNEFKKEILYKHSINLNSRITNYLNNTGKKTKPKTLDMLDESELPAALSTIVSMCKENDIDISDLVNKKAS